MENNNLGEKLSLKKLLDKYNRIEIPVIQRDYAQGRTGKAETNVRQGILNHILNALAKGNDVELDFIYGVERKYGSGAHQSVAFVPIDGQQRLTTLWLIHWYLACKAGLLSELNMLRRFTYETRVSSRDFLNCLCTQTVNASPDIKRQIVEESTWFNDAWLLDPSVTGFLTMLDAIANHKVVKNGDCAEMYSRLVADESKVSFYFLPLDKFGLGEEIYTRMNARGKMLTSFEVFKSNFFKIIDDSPLKEEITRKIEYDWVSNLWPYRSKDEYVTDKPFMNWLRYVTQMRIETSSESNTRKKGGKNDVTEDYLSLDTLANVYRRFDNLQFLVDSFNLIPKLSELEVGCSLEWKSDDKDNKDDKGLASAVKRIVTDGKQTDVVKQMCVYAAINFLRRYPDGKGIADFIRVVRNLLKNTNDNSIREWPNMMASINRLMSQQDVYGLLANTELSLKGFRTEQQEVEVFKAKFIRKRPDDEQAEAHELICEMDENPLLTARVGNLILELLEPEATDKFTRKLKDVKPETVDVNKLRDMFSAYQTLSTLKGSNNFDAVWGEFLVTDLYSYNNYQCWWSYDSNYDDYATHPAVLKLVREVMDNGGGADAAAAADAAIMARQKREIKKLIEKTGGELSSLTDPKSQLYVLYVGTVSIFNLSYKKFFPGEDRYNFGWVSANAGNTSPFASIDGSRVRNPIFQAFPIYFTRRDEIIECRTPYIMHANARGKNFFKKLSDWVKS